MPARRRASNTSCPSRGSNLPSHAETLAELLRGRGHRVTRQRTIVFDALRKGARAGKHLSAETVYERVRQQHPEIDRATIYRTLNFFCELGLVHQADLNGRHVFEPTGTHPHHHLLCARCGHTLVLNADALQDLARTLLRKTGFRLDARHLILPGVCAHCARAAEQTA